MKKEEYLFSVYTNSLNICPNSCIYFTFDYNQELQMLQTLISQHRKQIESLSEHKLKPFSYRSISVLLFVLFNVS